MIKPSNYNIFWMMRSNSDYCQSLLPLKLYNSCAIQTQDLDFLVICYHKHGYQF